jgi:hypothetical protein
VSPNESREQPLPRNLPRAFGAAVVATGVYAAWLGWQIGGEKSVLYFSDAGTILASFLACAACIRAATRHKDRMRGFWWLLGAACGAWMLGEVIWTVYDVTGSGGPPIPRWRTSATSRSSRAVGAPSATRAARKECERLPCLMVSRRALLFLS